jgi:flagellar motor switch protein FliM
VAYGRRGSTDESIQRISRNLRGSLVEVVVRLARTKISTGDLVGLRVGDIIATEKDIHSPVLVSVEGVPKFHARPGAYRGHKAICIHDAISSAADVVGE